MTCEDNRVMTFYHNGGGATAKWHCTEIPAELGTGRRFGFTTPGGFACSTWEMNWWNDLAAEGQEASDLQLRYCTGCGTEWKTAENGRTVSFFPGQICLTLGEEKTESITYEGGLDYRFDCVSIKREALEQILELYVGEEERIRLKEELKKAPCLFPADSESATLFQQLREIKQTDGLSALHAEGLLCELLALTLQKVGAHGMDRLPFGISSDDEAILRSIYKRIEQEPGTIPGCKELAREYGVSVSKLTKDFRRRYGMPLHACVIEARLQEAARLLSEGTMTVGEVAERVGYAKQGNFSSAFYRHFGVLPKEY